MLVKKRRSRTERVWRDVFQERPNDGTARKTSRRAAALQPREEIVMAFDRCDRAQARRHTNEPDCIAPREHRHSRHSAVHGCNLSILPTSEVRLDAELHETTGQNLCWRPPARPVRGHLGEDRAAVQRIVKVNDRLDVPTVLPERS